MVENDNDLLQITFATDWKAQAELGGFYQALASGKYLEKGLDVKIIQGNANINIPIYNCTSDVVTTWVEPIGKEESIVEERAGNKVVKGETEVEFLTSNHKILEEANLVGDRCCLFKGDVWHKVDVLHKRNETRVMSKIWSRGLVWEEMLEKYKDFIDDSFSPT